MANIHVDLLIVTDMILSVWYWYFGGSSLSPQAYNFQFIVSGTLGDHGKAKA